MDEYKEVNRKNGFIERPDIAEHIEKFIEEARMLDGKPKADLTLFASFIKKGIILFNDLGEIRVAYPDSQIPQWLNETKIINTILKLFTHFLFYEKIHNKE